MINSDLEKILIDRNQIQQRVQELAQDISRDYAGKDLLLIAVLKGAVVFLADLSRALTVPHEMDLIGAASYGDQMTSSGQVRITKDIENDLRGKHVLLIEDIYDTGRTLEKICELVQVREPAGLEICCLLEKPDVHQVDLSVKYIGFSIPDEFVVGYGLDYNEKYRYLRDIGILNPRVLNLDSPSGDR